MLSSKLTAKIVALDCVHSSFNLKMPPVDAPTRESIEVRALVFSGQSRAKKAVLSFNHPFSVFFFSLEKKFPTVDLGSSGSEVRRLNWAVRRGEQPG